MTLKIKQPPLKNSLTLCHPLFRCWNLRPRLNMSKPVTVETIPDDPSPVREDGLQLIHYPSNQDFQNPEEKQVCEAPRVVPDSEEPGKEEDKEPPDNTKEKKKVSSKPNPYPENSKFPQILSCKLCPRKFFFVQNLCTHVEIHHRSQFKKITYGPHKFSAMLRLVQEWVRDIKREPSVLEMEVYEEPEVPEKPPDGGPAVDIVQVVNVAKHGKTASEPTQQLIWVQLVLKRKKFPWC
jgi:hypothetical protein